MHSEQEHFLMLLIEECNEIIEAAQKVSYLASKTFRFGHYEVQAGRDAMETNARRLIAEIHDFIAVCERLGQGCHWFDPAKVEGKHVKLEKFLKLARNTGSLEPPMSERMICDIAYECYAGILGDKGYSRAEFTNDVMRAVFFRKSIFRGLNGNGHRDQVDVASDP